MYETQYHTEDLSKFSFLVTGGAGFIGSNIVEYLLKYNAGKVRVLDNFSTGSRENIKDFLTNPAFELIDGDIRDFETCKKAVEGMDYVSHQAALCSVPRSINDPITTNDVNISGFLNILTAVRNAKVKKMVYAASSSTYGDHPGLPKVEDQIGKPLSPYAVSKYVNELYADVFSRLYDFHTIGLRYFNVFGPKQDPNGPYAAVIPLFIKAALENQAPIINGDGEQNRDFTFVENVVQANVKALFAKNILKHEVMNIAFGEKTSLNQLWIYIQQLALKDIPASYGQSRLGDIVSSHADISKAKDIIEYKPVFNLKEGLKISVSSALQSQTNSKTLSQNSI